MVIWNMKRDVSCKMKELNPARFGALGRYNLKTSARCVLTRNSECERREWAHSHRLEVRGEDEALWTDFTLAFVIVHRPPTRPG
jgi:hypothetical protein